MKDSIFESIDGKVQFGRKESHFQCYALTNTHTDEDKTEFYERLQMVLNEAPKCDIEIITKGLNTKHGHDNRWSKGITGTHNMGMTTDGARQSLAQSRDCQWQQRVLYKLLSHVTGGHILPHKDKAALDLMDWEDLNQTDHITIHKYMEKQAGSKANEKKNDTLYHHYFGTFKRRAFRDTATEREAEPLVLHPTDLVPWWIWSRERENKWRALELWETIGRKRGEPVDRRDRQRNEQLSWGTWQLISKRKLLKEISPTVPLKDNKKALQPEHLAANSEVKRSAMRDQEKLLWWSYHLERRSSPQMGLEDPLPRDQDLIQLKVKPKNAHEGQRK